MTNVWISKTQSWKLYANTYHNELRNKGMTGALNNFPKITNSLSSKCPRVLPGHEGNHPQVDNIPGSPILVSARVQPFCPYSFLVSWSSPFLCPSFSFIREKQRRLQSLILCSILSCKETKPKSSRNLPR